MKKPMLIVLASLVATSLAFAEDPRPPDLPLFGNVRLSLA